MRRHLALWFPFLSADRLRIQEPDRCVTSPDAPLVLFARAGNALRVAAGDAHAAQLGLGPGTTLADARARHPALTAVEHDAPADRHWLEKLGRDCVRYAPVVTLAPPDGVTVDITGAAHLLGGERALADMALDRLAGLGMTVRAACGPTAEAALALARHGRWPAADEPRAIEELPVQALGLPAESAMGLRRAGLTTVGAVAARPMSAIAARFGIEAVRAVQRLLGVEQVPGAPLIPARPIRVERRFAEPVAHQQTIASVLSSLLSEAAAALEERAQGGRRFVLTLCRSDGAVHSLAVETGAPTRDPAVVLRLFDERIETLADPLDPGFGYDSMRLAVPVSEPLAASQPMLDGAQAGGDSHSQEVAQLIDRLSTRLGPERIRRLVPRDSHIPEQAQLAFPAIRCPQPARWTPTAASGEPPTRPLFLFDPPQPVEVIAEVPDGPPHRFRWRRALHEVRLYEGPERIAPEWWRHRDGQDPGKGGLTRDYYRVEDARGRRFWLFRHGLYEERPDPRWYVHGLFA